MQTEDDKKLFAPLFLFLWAGYLFFGAYYQFVRQDAFPGFSPALFLIAGMLAERLSLQVCTAVATVLGLGCAVCGVWVAKDCGGKEPAQRDE
jgi:hypothetical protein